MHDAQVSAKRLLSALFRGLGVLVRHLVPMWRVRSADARPMVGGRGRWPTGVAGGREVRRSRRTQGAAQHWREHQR